MIRYLLPLFLVSAAFGAALPNNPATVLLWEGAPPNSKSTELTEEFEYNGQFTRIKNVQAPALEVRLPSTRNATGRAVLVIPGGGYANVAYDLGGTDAASLLNAHGIAAIILKYRLPQEEISVKPELSPLIDAKRAMRMTRYHAEAWGFSPNEIGVMGYSAGGHLASTLGTRFDEGDPNAEDPIERISSRPDFMALIYPVITMEEGVAHPGSRLNLLGESPSPEQVAFYSNELQVKPSTPPSFIVHSADDQLVPIANSLRIYNALLENGVSAELHVYPYGGHGYSLAIGKGRLSNWGKLSIDWINSLELNN